MTSLELVVRYLFSDVEETLEVEALSPMITVFPDVLIIEMHQVRIENKTRELVCLYIVKYSRCLH